jgi:hypothetical protein
MDINRPWETVRQNINISTKERLGYYKMKQAKPWINKGSSKLLDQREQEKFQCYRIPAKQMGII